MTSRRMLGLGAFRFDEGIEHDEVELSVADDEGALAYQMLPLAEAIARAHILGLHLIQSWPCDAGQVPSCHFGHLTLPVRWEEVDAERAEPDIDHRLWFEAPCGGRDFLLDGNPDTFPGRMYAWCGEKRITYRVSLGEMGEMSDESRYFVRGFLSGDVPGPPEDDQGRTNDDDFSVWLEAAARFHHRGSWGGGFSTCEACGRVVVPGSGAVRCASHLE